MYCKYKTEEHQLPDGVSRREIQKLLHMKKPHLIRFKGNVHFQGEWRDCVRCSVWAMGLCDQRTLQTQSLPCVFIIIRKSI